MLVLLATLLGGVAAFCWAANPYAAWRADPIAEIPRLHPQPADEAQQRARAAYRIRLVHPQTILLGSSRVLIGMPVDDRLHEEVLNAAVSGASVDEVDALLRLASRNSRLRQVIWGIDFFAFTQQMEGFRYREIGTRLALDGIGMILQRVRETLLSAQAVDYSREAFARAWAGIEMRPKPLSTPWPAEVLRDTLAYAREDGLIGTADNYVSQQLPGMDWLYRTYKPSSKQLALARDLVTRTRANGIDLVMFVPVLSECELEIIRAAGAWRTFQQWKRDLLAAVGPYRDFSGYNDVARDEALFVDVYHYKSAVGQVMLVTMRGESCTTCGETAQVIRDSGVWVDADTIDNHLARQDQMMSATDPHPSRCRALLEHMTHSAPPAGAS
jgi:hypothetical protein